MKKVCIIGSGRQGTAAGYDLVRSLKELDLTFLDIDYSQAEKASKRIESLLRYNSKSESFDILKKDVLIDFLKPYDIFLSSVPYQFNPYLTDVAIDSAESLCISVRSFFRDIKTVRDNAHKVTFYEKESDKQTSELQRKIFKSDLTLDQKMHLRYFVEKIDQIADHAEHIADELQIYSIKRSI